LLRKAGVFLAAYRCGVKVSWVSVNVARTLRGGAIGVCTGRRHIFSARWFDTARVVPSSRPECQLSWQPAWVRLRIRVHGMLQCGQQPRRRTMGGVEFFRSPSPDSRVVCLELEAPRHQWSLAETWFSVISRSARFQCSTCPISETKQVCPSRCGKSVCDKLLVKAAWRVFL